MKVLVKGSGRDIDPPSLAAIDRQNLRSWASTHDLFIGYI